MKTLIATLTLLAAVAATAPAAASPAPDFTLKTLDGPALRLAEQRGQVVLVNFWASWCAPCKVEMPHLNALADKYRHTGVVLVGINVDDDPKKAAAEARKLGIRFPVLLDTDKAASKAYKLEAMPTTVLVDRDGRVRHVHQGYRPGYETTYDAQIRALVTE
jgi:peroxiredoxin